MIISFAQEIENLLILCKFQEPFREFMIRLISLTYLLNILKKHLLHRIHNNELQMTSCIADNIRLAKMSVQYEPFIHYLSQSLPFFSAAYLHLPKEDVYAYLSWH